MSNTHTHAFKQDFLIPRRFTFMNPIIMPPEPSSKQFFFSTENNCTKLYLFRQKIFHLFLTTKPKLKKIFDSLWLLFRGLFFLLFCLRLNTVIAIEAHYRNGSVGIALNIINWTCTSVNGFRFYPFFARMEWVHLFSINLNLINCSPEISQQYERWKMVWIHRNRPFELKINKKKFVFHSSSGCFVLIHEKKKKKKINGNLRSFGSPHSILQTIRLNKFVRMNDTKHFKFKTIAIYLSTPKQTLGKLHQNVTNCKAIDTKIDCLHYSEEFFHFVKCFNRKCYRKLFNLEFVFLFWNEPQSPSKDWLKSFSFSFSP